MEAVRIPAGTVLLMNGIPVKLATDVIVEVAHGNMQFLTGHHYAHLPDPPDTGPDIQVTWHCDPAPGFYMVNNKVIRNDV